MRANINTRYRPFELPPPAGLHQCNSCPPGSVVVVSTMRHIWARTTVTFPIDDHCNVLAPTLKIYPTIFFLFTENDRPTKTPGV